MKHMDEYGISPSKKRPPYTHIALLLKCLEDLRRQGHVPAGALVVWPEEAAIAREQDPAAFREGLPPLRSQLGGSSINDEPWRSVDNYGENRENPRKKTSKRRV